MHDNLQVKNTQCQYKKQDDYNKADEKYAAANQGRFPLNVYKGILSGHLLKLFS